jgi:hypothetical protein
MAKTAWAIENAAIPSNIFLSIDYPLRRTA